jgi:hypothetical protein
MGKPTRKLPWLTCMQVDFHQSTLQNFLVCDLFVKIMADQLLITRIKPKPGRECSSNVSQPHKNDFSFEFHKKQIVGDGMWMVLIEKKGLISLFGISKYYCIEGERLVIYIDS